MKEIQMEKMPLPQPVRIKKRRCFLRATHNGKKFISKTMILQTVAQTKTEGMRLGFTVTKKIGHAVVRNRVRRRLKEAARFVLPVHGLNGFDYVVVGREEADEAPFDVLKRDLTYLLGLFKKRLAEEKEIDQNTERDSELLS